MSNLEEAVERVLRGETSAFQQIVDVTNARLVRLSARIVGNVTDAEDVVQEAYVKAYRSLVGGQFDRRARVDTWLYRIVVNASIDAKRKRQRSDETIEAFPDAAWDGAALAEARLALSELADWLRDLPADQHATLVLKSIEGLSSAEIAEILECSEGAVEQRLVRARAALWQKEQRQ